VWFCQPEGQPAVLQGYAAAIGGFAQKAGKLLISETQTEGKSLSPKQSETLAISEGHVNEQIGFEIME
jgi:hypothetical protein